MSHSRAAEFQSRGIYRGFILADRSSKKLRNQVFCLRFKAFDSHRERLNVRSNHENVTRQSFRDFGLRQIATHFDLLRYMWHPVLFMFAAYIIVLSSWILVVARLEVIASQEAKGRPKSR